jgi:hypothetical protein
MIPDDAAIHGSDADTLAGTKHAKRGDTILKKFERAKNMRKRGNNARLHEVIPFSSL